VLQYEYQGFSKTFLVVFPAEWFVNRMAKNRGAAAPSILEAFNKMGQDTVNTQ
jgi:hypothetical protein